MTFPTIPTVAANRLSFANQLNNTAARVFPALPTGRVSGDLLIAIVYSYSTGAAAGSIWTWTAGWTELADLGGSNLGTIGIAYRWSTGGSDPALTATEAGLITGDAAMMVMAIPGAHASTPPEVTAITQGTTAVADPPSLDPAGWATEDTLWISVIGDGMSNATGSWTGLAGVTAPTNYTNFVETAAADTSTAGDCSLGVAFRQLAASSENSGPFVGPDVTNARNSALVIAVRPAGAPAVPIAEYGFNEGSGTTAADSAGGTPYNLTASHATNSWSATGKNGAGAKSPQYSGAMGPNTALTNYTVMFWARRDGTHTGFAGLLTDNTGSFFIEVDAGVGYKPNIWTGTNALVATTAMSLSTWEHWAFVVSGATMTIYRNAVSDGSNAFGSSQNFGGSDNRLLTNNGEHGEAGPFNGVIDELRVFDQALSPAQITTWMNTAIGGGTTSVSSDLDVRWRTRSTVTSDHDIRWETRQTVTADHDIRWRTRTAISSDHDLRWRTLTPVAPSDHDLRWATKATVTSDHDLRWATLEAGGASYRIFSPAPPALAADADTAGVNLGIEFTVTAACSLTHFHFLQPISGVPSLAQRTFDLWEMTSATTGTRVAGPYTVTPVSGDAGTWVTVTLGTPFALTIGKTYRAICHHAAGKYAAEAVYFLPNRLGGGHPGSGGIISGPLSVPDTDAANSGDQGSYKYGGASQLTDAAFNDTNYWTDVTVRTPGGSSPITSDLDVRWVTRGQVVSDLDVRWRTRVTATSDHDVRWRTLTAVTADHDLRWRTRATVTSDADLRWVTRAQVNSDADLRWRTRVTATSDVDVRWRTRVTVEADHDLRWATLVSAGAVSSDLELRWVTRATITSDVDVRWRTLTAVSSNHDLRWRSLQTVTSDTDLRWITRAQVTRDHDLRWRTLTVVSVDHDIRWRTKTSVSADLDLRWRTLQTLTVDHDLRWRTLVGITSDHDLRWVTLVAAGTVTSELDLRWRTRETTTSDLDVRWRTLVGITADHDLRWRTLTAVLRDHDLRWRTAGLITSDVDLRWRTRQTMAFDHDLRWRTFVRIPTSDHDLRWRTLTAVTRDHDFRWVTRGATTSDLELRWTTRGRTTSDHDIRWATFLLGADIDLTVDTADRHPSWTVTTPTRGITVHAGDGSSYRATTGAGDRYAVTTGPNQYRNG